MNLRAMLFLVGVLGIAGCGSGTTDVAGTVKYQGKTVVFGSVVLLGADGLPKSGPIQPNGTFLVSGVKPGTVKVYVSSPRPPGLAGPTVKLTGRDAGAGDDERTPKASGTLNPEVAKGWFPLPESFGDPKLATLTAEIAAGQPHDIDLK